MPAPAYPIVPSRRIALWRWAGVALVVMALLGVFSLYTQPDFMVTLATQVWSCF